MAVTIRTTYVPSNSIRQMNAARARHGVPASRLQSMQEFLLSRHVQDAADDAAEDIADWARAIAQAEITSETSSGAYEASIEARSTEPVVVAGNARRAAAVTANGGRASWGGFTDPESSHAVVVEFGNPSAPHSGRRIFGRVGALFDTPKRPA
jgi:hypothetical protein